MMADNIESTAPVTDGAAPEAAAPEGQRRGRGVRGGGDNRGGGSGGGRGRNNNDRRPAQEEDDGTIEISSTSTVFLKQLRAVSASALRH